MNRDEILKIVQENNKNNLPDEMEQQHILKSARISTLVFLAMMILTLIFNAANKNTIGISENIALIAIVTGAADYYFDKKKNNKFRKKFDVFAIFFGFFFYIAFIGLLMVK